MTCCAGVVPRWYRGGMKLDLDDLDRKARGAGASDGDMDWICPDPSCLASEAEKAFIEATSPQVVAALIARIRELEDCLDGALGEIESRATGADQPLQERALLEKGIVLP
jgi:hypothetical protein